MSAVPGYRPTEPVNHVGMELETLLDSWQSVELDTALKALHPSAAADYQYHGGCHGAEAHICVPETEVANWIPKFMDVIRGFKGHGIDEHQRRLGIHFHLDTRFRPYATMKQTLIPRAPELFAIAAPWRASFRSATHDVCGFARRSYETIECRQLDSNLDTERTMKFLNKLLSFVRDVPPARAMREAA